MKTNDEGITYFPIRAIHGDWKRGRKHKLWLLPDGDLFLELRRRDSDLNDHVPLSKITRLVQTSGRQLATSWLACSLLNPSFSLVDVSWASVALLRDPLPPYMRKQIRFLMEFNDGRYLCAKARRYVFDLIDNQLERLVDAQEVRHD